MVGKPGAPETPSYTDENGEEYKICKGCEKKIYYEDWFNEKVYGGKARAHALKYFWRFKGFCSTECMNQFRTKQFKICKHCGTKFYRNKSYSKGDWENRTMCSKSCSLEFGWVFRLSSVMGIPYETLRDELMKIAEKYKK